MTGNPILERYMAEVVTRCSLILSLFGRPHSTDCACSEHQELIEAFRQRDTKRAVTLMSEHLHGIERRALLPDVVAGSAGLVDVLTRYAASVTIEDTAVALSTVKKSKSTPAKSSRPPAPSFSHPSTKRSSP
jgi:hypothetical protein